MALSAAAVAYTAVGGLVLWSGIEGVTLAATVQQVLKGNLSKSGLPSTDLEPIDFSGGGSSASGTSGSASSVTVDPGASQTQWNTDLLKAIGAPATSANLSSLADWESKEEPTSDWDHWNNPLNTTVGTTGVVAKGNSVGVNEFDNLQDGLNATAQTLEQGNFEAIRMALIAGQGLAAGNSQVASELSTWSGGGYSSV